MNYCRVRRQPPTSATATFWLTQRRPRVTFGCSRCTCPAHLAWITSLGTYRLGDSTLAPWRLAALAQAALVSRDLRTAGGLIVDALDMIGRTGVRWWEAEVHRSGGVADNNR